MRQHPAQQFAQPMPMEKSGKGKQTGAAGNFLVGETNLDGRAILLTPPAPSCSGAGWLKTIRKRFWNWNSVLPLTNSAALTWRHSAGRKDLCALAVAGEKLGQRNEGG
jgi:hypothetical protein